MHKSWLKMFTVSLWMLVSFQSNAMSPPGLVVTDIHGDQTTLSYMQWQYELQADVDWTQIAASNEWQTLEQNSLGFQFKPVWTRLTLTNPSAKPQTHVLYNPHAGMDQIDVTLIYQTQDNVDRIEQHELGLIRSIKNQPIPQRFSTLLIHLDPYQQVTLYTRLQTLGAYQVDWRIAQPQTFSKNSQEETLFWGVFGGLIIFLVIYNFWVMRRIKQSVLWPYIAFALMSLYYQYATKGLLRFDPTGLTNTVVTLMTWVTPFLILASLTYFSMLLLNTKTNLPKLHQVLKVAIAIYLLAFVAHLSGVVQMFGYMTPGLTIAYIGFTLPVVVGIIAWRHKILSAGYYLAGQSALMVGHLTQVLVLDGLIPNNFLTSFAIPIGILFELFFLSLAFAHRVAKMSQDHERQRRLMIAQSRFSSIGQAFGNVSYEWRTPLVHLGSQLTELESRLVQQPWQDTRKAMDDLLHKMQTSLHGLMDTVDKFQRFYSVDNKTQTFEVRQRLQDVLNLLKGKQAWSMIVIDVYAPQAIKIQSYPNSFSQVLMLLLDQAISLQQDHKRVLIRLEKIDQQLVVQLSNIYWPLEDTEIGSDADSIERLNLATVQVLVEDKLQGNITFSRQDDRMQINLTLPLNLQ